MKKYKIKWREATSNPDEPATITKTVVGELERHKQLEALIMAGIPYLWYETDIN